MGMWSSHSPSLPLCLLLSSSASSSSKATKTHQRPCPVQLFKIFAEDDGCKSSTGTSVIVEEAFRRYHLLVHSQPFPKIVAFNKLFGTLAKCKHYSTVISMYKNMDSLKIHTDVVTLTILLNCFCGLYRLDLGFSVFGITMKRGFDPDIVTLNTLLKGLCMVDKIADAKELFYKILQEGYPCDEITYLIIINGLCKTGDTNEAFEMLNEMELKGKCKPSVTTYSSIIDGLCKGRINEALNLFSDMVGLGRIFRVIRNWRPVEYSHFIRERRSLCGWPYLGE
ncbi:pentatricopeptide repeat-containing protein At1g62680, mitochondrial-like [Macadamia integrifolia]|uniref:pentatricopeptide repeat-containing protein At1g62680, mitochondrial-like n=1 Tax=Macadamia integrifolia TaxID=60698 RepID=UPI001C4F34C1|nr:pentatricopeptide repeat-containing protein At1g62680, mitochondrial-like [Macadamia integrifolia]